MNNNNIISTITYPILTELRFLESTKTKTSAAETITIKTTTTKFQLRQQFSWVVKFKGCLKFKWCFKKD